MTNKKNAFDTNFETQDCTFTIKESGEEIDGFKITFEDGHIEYALNSLYFLEKEEVEEKSPESAYKGNFNQLAIYLSNTCETPLVVSNFDEIRAFLELVDKFLPDDLKISFDNNNFARNEYGVFQVAAIDFLQKRNLVKFDV